MGVLQFLTRALPRSHCPPPPKVRMAAALLLSFLSPCKRPLPAPRNRLLCLARLGRWEYTSRRGTAAARVLCRPLRRGGWGLKKLVVFLLRLSGAPAPQRIFPRPRRARATAMPLPSAHADAPHRSPLPRVLSLTSIPALSCALQEERAPATRPPGGRTAEQQQQQQQPVETTQVPQRQRSRGRGRDLFPFQ